MLRYLNKTTKHQFDGYFLKSKKTLFGKINQKNSIWCWDWSLQILNFIVPQEEKWGKQKEQTKLIYTDENSLKIQKMTMPEKKNLLLHSNQNDWLLLYLKNLVFRDIKQDWTKQILRFAHQVAIGFCLCST